MHRRLEENYDIRAKRVTTVRSAWRLETDAGSLYLKRAIISRAELPFVVGLHGYLSQVAPGLAPRILRTASGADWLDVDGDAYLLSDCLTGREADYLRPGDQEAVAAGLAQFHRLAGGYRSPGPAGARRWYGTWPARIAVRLRDLERYQAAAGSGKGRFDRTYLALGTDYQRQAERARACLGTAEYRLVSARAATAGEVCHHDLAHHNMLLDSGWVRFVDLDYAVADTILHDLANLAGHLLRLSGWDIAPVQAVLERYWQGRTPSLPALKVLGAMLIWPQDYWQIGRQYYDERQPWTEEEFLDLLERKCGQPQARALFLRRFWREYELR